MLFFLGYPLVNRSSKYYGAPLIYYNDDGVALLAIAHLVQKLIDCSRSLGEKEVREVALQYQVVTKLCDGRPLFCDCYSTIHFESILAAHEEYKRLSIETSKVTEDVVAMVNLVEKMYTLQDLLTLEHYCQ